MKSYTILNIGFRLHFLIKYEFSDVREGHDANITQHVNLALSSETKASLDDFIVAIEKVNHFLCFGINATVAISRVRATSNEIVKKIPNGSEVPIEVGIYYRSSPFSEDLPRIDLYRALFSFGDIEHDAEGILNRWMSLFSESVYVPALYFFAITGVHQYWDRKFIALAQCLETYHRRKYTETNMLEKEFEELKSSLISSCPEKHKKWLESRLRFGNEISLNRRIKAVVKPFEAFLGDRQKVKKFVNDIVANRNYFTHYSEDLKEKLATGKDLPVLCRKMEAIIQLLFLQQLDFDDAKIKVILNNEFNRIQEKLVGR